MPRLLSDAEAELRQDQENLEAELDDLEAEYWSTEDEREAAWIQNSMREIESALARLNVQILLSMMRNFA